MTAVVGQTTCSDTRMRSGEFLAPALVSTTVSLYVPSASPSARALSRIESRPTAAATLKVSGVIVSHEAPPAIRAFTPSVTVPGSVTRR